MCWRGERGGGGGDAGCGKGLKAESTAIDGWLGLRATRKAARVWQLLNGLDGFGFLSLFPPVFCFLIHSHLPMVIGPDCHSRDAFENNTCSFQR